MTATISKDAWYDWDGANQWLFDQINALNGDTYDSAMVFLSHLADRHNFPYYLAGLLAFALLSYIVGQILQKGGTSNLPARWTGVFLVLIASFAVEASVIHYLKDYFSYPRPYMSVGHYVRILEPRLDTENYHSFPSGHVAFITLMVVGLWPMLPGVLKGIGVAIIVGVAWSRVALGAHYPADVVGSVVIMLPLLLIVSSIVYKTLRRFGIRC